VSEERAALGVPELQARRCGILGRSLVFILCQAAVFVSKGPSKVAAKWPQLSLCEVADFV
jgi:hypothetical protein